MSAPDTTQQPVNDVLILGGGTAGFLVALTLRKRIPSLRVRVLQSSKLGVIGVGEGSLRQLPGFLHRYLGIDPARFFAEVAPTWKLGIRFKWGARGDFNYTFAPQVDLVHSHPDLPRPIGFYCFDELEDHCVASVLMRSDYVYRQDAGGAMEIGDDYGYHLDNERFAGFLQRYALEQGIELLDDLVTRVDAGDRGIERLHLERGEALEADLFVDCSGFASLLVGKTLGEKFQSYRDTLFCDRAVIGGWERSDEPIHPYTTCETMDAGWCWQIEHERRINRGYVYASDFISDDEAEAEYRRANPKVGATRTLKFRSGRFENAWVKNAVAIGNASGFVEPLEATAIAAICTSSRALAESLAEARGPVTPTMRRCFNQHNARGWDTIADFLAVHYRFNTLRDTPFWRACQADVNLRGAAPIVEYYQQNGPSQLWRLALEDPLCRFKLDGYYTLLLGQGVPHALQDDITLKERTAFSRLKEATRQYAARGFTVGEALAAVRSPGWKWQQQHFAVS